MRVKTGDNLLDGIRVFVERKRTKRINLRIRSDGTVLLSIPAWRATLADGAAFLSSKWRWVVAARAKAMAAGRNAAKEYGEDDKARLAETLAGMHSYWSMRLGEGEVPWRLRVMKTRWGVCNWAKRRISYAVMLAGVSRDLVEYVCVHELTHLQAHGHGARFQSLMDERLPDWRERRKRLNATGL